MLENYIQLSSGQQDLVETFCFINVLKPGGDMEQMEIQYKETFEVGYEDMVTKLFKKHGMHTHHEGLMHAAIGISGEAGEIFEAFLQPVPDKDNLVEEYGDMEFYMEAICQAAQVSDDALGSMCEILLKKEPGHQYLLTDMVIIAADILDTAKRCWVYGKDLEAMRPKLVTGLAHLTLCIDQIYKAAGTKYEDIRYLNQVKLIGAKGRYRDQVYSDDAANARADKQGE